MKRDFDKEININDEFGKLKVLEKMRIAGKGFYLKCECCCGKIIKRKASVIAGGKTKSCGCSRLEGVTKHKLSRSAEYYIWRGIKQRYNNTNSPRYVTYGKKGIKICKKWLNFEKFYEDMGPRPTPTHTIDRKNNNKGYCKSNCKWSTKKERANNRSTNIILEFEGKKQTLKLWAEEVDISYSTIYSRYIAGYLPPELFNKRYLLVKRYKEIAKYEKNNSY